MIKRTTSIIIFLLISSGLYLSYPGLLNSDAAWHLYVAKLLLAGNNLYTDIPEVNFPFIYYLRTIPWIISVKMEIEPSLVSKIIDSLIALTSIIISLKISKSRFGYALKAIKENENTASAVGINKTKYKLYAMVVSTVMVSICGSFYVNYLRFVDPDVMIMQNSIEMVLPVVMGGIGTVIGPIIGAIVFVPMAETLRVLLGGIIFFQAPLACLYLA